MEAIEVSVVEVVGEESLGALITIGSFKAPGCLGGTESQVLKFYIALPKSILPDMF